MQTLRGKDLLDAARLCAEAFLDTPHIKYFFPDRARRESDSIRLFEMRIRYGLLYGEVHVTSSEMEGIAVWLPASHARMTMWRQIKAGGSRLFWAVGKAAVGRMTKVASYNDTLRTRNVPPNHWFLSILAVSPQCQGQGFASRLIRPKLKQLDNSGSYAYLETTEARLVPMYERYDFVVREELSIPGSSLTVYAMTRVPC
jgi:ribosomal protein S18 acetylase RimI-like enzyme